MAKRPEIHQPTWRTGAILSFRGIDFIAGPDQRCAEYPGISGVENFFRVPTGNQHSVRSGATARTWR